MIARTAGEIASAVGGIVAVGPVAARATGVGFDSRLLKSGEAFFALAGERDGHDFIGAALARGCKVVVAQRLPDAPLPQGVALVKVDDTLAALGRLATDERTRRGLLVVGITGSAGKTTTRALAGAAIAAGRRCGTSQGNLNNHIGVPVSLLGLPAEAEVAVLEMGMNHAGEIARLAAIAKPEIGVVTNIGTAHIGNLGGKDGIAAAKAELLYGLAEGGVGIVHAGSPELEPHLADCRRRIVRFGFEDDADLVPRDLAGDLVRGATFTLEGVAVQLALWGPHAVLNACAALAAAREAGVPFRTAAPALAAVEAPAGRGRVLHLAGGTVLVDEVYNANPSAMEAVLAGLADVRWDGRRTAVLGDMLELGEFEADYHRLLGRNAAIHGIEELHAVGPLAAETARGAREAGLPDTHVHVHADAEAAAHAVPATVRDGDLLVVKGSRGIALERVREAVLAQRPVDASAAGGR